VRKEGKAWKGRRGGPLSDPVHREVNFSFGREGASEKHKKKGCWVK